MEYWKHLGDLFITVTVPQVLIGIWITRRQRHLEHVVKDGFKEAAMQAGELKEMRRTVDLVMRDKHEAVELALKVPPPPGDEKK